MSNSLLGKKQHLFIHRVLPFLFCGNSILKCLCYLDSSFSHCRAMALVTGSHYPLPAILRNIISRSGETKFIKYKEKKSYLWEGSSVAYQNNYFKTDTTQLCIEAYFISWPISRHIYQKNVWEPWFIMGNQINSERCCQSHPVFHDGTWGNKRVIGYFRCSRTMKVPSFFIGPLLYVLSWKSPWCW